MQPLPTCSKSRQIPNFALHGEMEEMCEVVLVKLKDFTIACILGLVCVMVRTDLTQHFPDAGSATCG